MTKLDDLIFAYDRCIGSNQTIIKKLKSKIEEIESFKVKCATAKTIGTTASVIGGIGLVAAPFTGGLSALVTGVVGTVAGLATNTITDIINNSETKQFIKELEDYNASRHEDTERLGKLLDELSKAVQGFRDMGHGEDEAITYAIMKMGGKDPSKSIKQRYRKPDSSLKISKLLEIGSTTTKIYLANVLVVSTLTASLGIKGLDFLDSVVKGFSAATTKAALRNLRIVTSVATVVFVVIDVALLVKEWASEHVAAEYGGKLVEQLKEELNCYQDMQQRLKRFKTEIDNSSGSSSEDECTCEPVELSVFYANIQSMRPNGTNADKCSKFCQYITQKNPDMVAIVETWLSPEIKNSTIQREWNLRNYELFRYDRTTSKNPQEAERRGGGILVGYNRAKLSQLDFDFVEDQEFINFSGNLSTDYLRFFTISKYFNCNRCRKTGLFPGSGLKTYSFILFYRRPRRFNRSETQEKEDSQEYRDQNQRAVSLLLDFFQGKGGHRMFSRSAGVVVGDFNWSHRQWSNYIGDIPALFRVPTTGNTYRGRTCPDGVIAVPAEFVPGPIPVLDCNTEHMALHFKMRFGMDYETDDPCEECALD